MSSSAVDAAAPTHVQGLRAPQDEIQLSALASQSLGSTQLDPQVRAARLAEIKTAIDAGAYETPQLLEAAIEKMLVAWSQGR
jgi:anti-sigma28 factor (negative regulator of flagellin synthesis)